MIRYAIIHGATSAKQVEAYLPSNYQVLGDTIHDKRAAVVIGGRDNSGWTLEGYVLPRLASGLMFGSEIDAEHPAMKDITPLR